MPGFLCEITKRELKKNFGKIYNSNLLIESIEGKNYFIERRTILKFLNDKVFFENEKYIILTEGVILNSKHLISKYGKRNLRETIEEMYEKKWRSIFQ